MQNGELDGYQAKLVVLEVMNPNGSTRGFADWPSGWAAVVAEIRARQPEAKILLQPPFPRGIQNLQDLTLQDWRKRSAANAAAFSGLVDNETVFYDDIGERFYDADGNYNVNLWGMPFRPSVGEGVGAQEPLFDLWAEALQPWLDRFVR
jgi:hypothetical protein